MSAFEASADRMRLGSFCLNGHRGALALSGITRRRTELGHQGMTDLANFTAFYIAEKAALENLDYLETKMVDLLQPPTSIADVALAPEVRQYVRRQKSPIDVAVKSVPP